MRDTHVITRLIVGGAQENTIATVLGLRETRGLDARLVSGPTSGAEGSLESQLNGRVPLTIEPRLVRPVQPLSDLLAFRHLVTLFRRQPPDIVHTHSGKAGVFGRLAARKAGVRTIVHTIHGPSFGPFQGMLANQVFMRAERRAGRVTTHFISVADAMTRQYLEAGIGRPGQFTTIRSGFDLQPYLAASDDPELRRKLGIGPQDIVIGKIARLFKLKGHEDLFAVAAEIVRQVPQTRFLLVGDGPWRERFERQLAMRALRSHFVFTGLVPPTDVPRYVGIMNGLVHLSRREGLARALPQAMAAGKAIVAFDCDGAREVCRPGETGFLVQPGDQAALIDAVVSIARSSDLRHQLGENGRRLARSQFDVGRMVDEIHSLYLRLRADMQQPGS
jgi:glycosyltransferase involved in cell wall biosynthesis